MDYLCLEFVNSAWYISHKLFADPIQDGNWMLQLAGKWNMNGLNPPTSKELQLLIKQRNEITNLFSKLVNGSSLDPLDLTLLNTYMENIDYKKKLLHKDTIYEFCVTPSKLNWEWFMSEVAASFSAMYSSNYLSLIKICKNPDCGWHFLDESKNHNRKWCDDTCSTLMKVRRFRQKQKKEGAL